MKKKPSPYSGRTNNERHKKDASAEPGEGGRNKFAKKGKFNKSEGLARSFEKSGKSFKREDKPFRKSDDKEKRFEDRKPREFKKPFDKSEKPFRNREDKPFNKDGKAREYKKPFDRSERPFRSKEDKPFDRDRKPREYKKPFDKTERSFRNKEDKPFDKDRKPREFKKPFDKKQDKPFGKPKFVKPKEENPFDRPFPLGTRKVSGPFRKKFNEEQENNKIQPQKSKKTRPTDEGDVKEMTLNKYIAHSGECSRRDAAALVKQGKVKVNGELMLDPGYRVKPEDYVSIAGKKLKPVKDLVYVLLNKPKDFITTTDDPQGRKTVMDLVENAGVPRLYPVGRLDRETTGLLLLTNDGDLAQKLSHPSYEIKKVYQVTLRKPLLKADFEKILAGLELEDGPVKVDALSYLDSKEELGIEIHSGRNRIVRRIFESLGYEIEKLDRVMYAGLTKKNLPRSKWRFLNEREVILLKHFKG